MVGIRQSAYLPTRHSGHCDGNDPRDFRASRLDPHESRVQITDGAVAVVAVAWFPSLVEGILAEERLAWFGHFQELASVAEDVRLPRADYAIHQSFLRA